MSDDDLIRRGDAEKAMLPFVHNVIADETIAAIAALPAVSIQPLIDAAVAKALEDAAGVPTDCRKWYYYPIEMPITKDGNGPAIPGRDQIASITYEVWDQSLESHASFDNLPDAINEAMRLSLAALIPQSGTDALRQARVEGMREALNVCTNYGLVYSDECRDVIEALIAREEP